MAYENGENCVSEKATFKFRLFLEQRVFQAVPSWSMLSMADRILVQFIYDLNHETKSRRIKENKRNGVAWLSIPYIQREIPGLGFEYKALQRHLMGLERIKIIHRYNFRNDKKQKLLYAKTSDLFDELFEYFKSEKKSSEPLLSLQLKIKDMEKTIRELPRTSGKITDVTVTLQSNTRKKGKVDKNHTPQEGIGGERPYPSRGRDHTPPEGNNSMLINSSVSADAAEDSEFPENPEDLNSEFTSFDDVRAPQSSARNNKNYNKNEAEERQKEFERRQFLRASMRKTG